VASSPGRNDGCPCGSGHKYKRCCLPRVEAARPAADPYPERLRRMQELSQNILRWVKGLTIAPKRAVRDFYGVANEGKVEEGDMPLFVTFLLWEWRATATSPPRGEKYLRARGSRAAAWEREYIEQALHQPWRFLEVTAVTPGWGIAVRDVFTATTEQVREISGSRQLRIGDIIFAQYVRVDGIVSFEAIAPLRMPPEQKADLVRMRQRVEKKIEGNQLRDADLPALARVMRYYYFDQVERLSQPPRLQNTDGEPLELHSLRYRIASPEAAFAALSPLALGWTAEELLEGGSLDARGKLRAIEFPWMKRGNRLHKSWDNTTLATLRLRGKTLTAEVNSARRAARLRREIERRLGEGAVFESETVTSADAMLAKAKRGRARPEPPRDPALIAAEEEMMARHMAEWLDTELPALDGQTPRAMVRTADGREMVEALLVGMGRRQPSLAAWARQELGIDA